MLVINASSPLRVGLNPTPCKERKIFYNVQSTLLLVFNMLECNTSWHIIINILFSIVNQYNNRYPTHNPFGSIIDFSWIFVTCTVALNGFNSFLRYFSWKTRFKAGFALVESIHPWCGRMMHEVSKSLHSPGCMVSDFFNKSWIRQSNKCWYLSGGFGGKFAVTSKSFSSSSSSSTIALSNF